VKSATKICAAVFSLVVIAILIANAVTWDAVAHRGADASIRKVFRPLCHGIESRCFAPSGVPMPLCARCVGIYLGMAGGIASFALFRSLRRRRWPPAVVIIAAMPLVLDGVTQAFGFRESTNGLRLITGIAAAAPFLIWVLQRVEVAAGSESNAAVVES
jgi:uncharacterized membrane protein